MPIKAIKWLLMHHSPLVIKPMLDAAMWRWGAGALGRSDAAQLHRGALPGQQGTHGATGGVQPRLHEVAARRNGHPLRRAHPGHLQLFRTQKQLDGTAKDIEILNQHGVPFELLDREGYLRHEPALRDVKHKFVGALRLPGDETGDCFKFTNELAKLAEGLGTKLHYGVEVRA